MTLLISGLGPQPERLSGVLYIWLYTIRASLPIVVFLALYESPIFYSPLDSDAVLPLSDRYCSLLLLGLLAKGPSYGLHLWLPQAHVEASSLGRVVLAGVLLKLRLIGLYRLRS